MQGGRAYDCFSAWDPTDDSTGNWNPQYDNIWLTGATHGWVDHNAFDDGDHPDSLQPLYFGRPYQWHDGELDISNAADLVTVSSNRFTDHDKVMLIGSSDSAFGDRGKLRVTLHHNLFDRVIQRGPARAPRRARSRRSALVSSTRSLTASFFLHLKRVDHRLPLESPKTIVRWTSIARSYRADAPRIRG